MARNKKDIGHDPLMKDDGKILHKFHNKGFALDAYAGEIPEFPKIGKSTLSDPFHLPGVETVVAVCIEIIGDHVAEHLVKDPGDLESS
jgi:hypothetical protein